MRSAGSEPATELNPSVVALLRRAGARPEQGVSQATHRRVGQEADVIVTMGCGDTCPVYPGKRYVDWDLDDPAGKEVEAVRPIVEEIDRRTQALLAELLGEAP